MNNHFCYMRISTKEERGKQRFTRQEKALDTYAKNHGTEFLISFREDASGKDFAHRGEWAKLEKLVQPGDTVVFKDLTRFTREAENGYKKYMELLGRGVNLVFLDNPTLSTDYIRGLIQTAREMNFLEKTVNEMLVKVLLAAELTRAEQERLTISQRTKDGLAATDKTPGRKPGKVDKLNDELREDIVKYLADRKVKAADLIRKHGVSRNTFMKYVDLVKREM